MPKKLLLIDGHSIINRAFYGLPDLTDASGQHTGAVYGFLTILFRFINEEQPDALAVAFDVNAPTFRHEIYPEYKGKRKPMPEELRSQVPLLKQVLDAMGIYRMEKAGLEADDLLGTAATRCAGDGWTVTIVSGDRDLLQVATESIYIAQPKTVKGQTTVKKYDMHTVEEEWGVCGERFIDLKALMGDTSDNIPGLPKVGEKTAMDLMKQFGSGDAIFERAEEITKKGLRETVMNNREIYDLSRTLATIDTDAPFEFETEKAMLPDGDFGRCFTQEAYELYKRLGFKNLLDRFDLDDPMTDAGVTPFDNDFARCRDMQSADELFDRAETSDREFAGVSFIYDHILGRDQLLGIAIASGDASGFVFAGSGVSEEYIGRKLAALSAKKRLCVYDIKKAYAFFTPAKIMYDDDTDAPLCFDALIAAYLLNPLKNDFTPEDIALIWLGRTLRTQKEIFGKNMFCDSPEDAAVYGVTTAMMLSEAAPVLEEKLKDFEMYGLFEEIEMPLTYILYDMERLGIIVRRDGLKEYGERLAGRINELEVTIHEQAGSPFNINSPKQLGEILFEKMGLPGGKKTKSGYSTAADVLEKLAEDAPIVRDVLEYRGLTKLKSTYADGLYEFIGSDGRIHTSFNQTITATGRISSSDPNLQNIPMRTALGREIRKVFVPAQGCVFADADYSQIELRILAAMSGDEGLISAYREGRDIHAITASKVFGVPLDEVTPLMRRNAKAVNFGIVYGISSFGLSQNIDISRKDAGEYIKQYFNTYPGVKVFLDSLVSSAKTKGYAQTMFGRRRPIPELNSENFMKRGFGERVAMNAPIQGTAADIMKKAMIDVWKKLKKDGMKTNMILQIHDELVLEAPEEEKEAAGRIMTEGMRSTADLAVPLEVECHFGRDWFEAKA